MAHKKPLQLGDGRLSGTPLMPSAVVLLVEIKADTGRDRKV
jgi:hypothetical protein